MRIAEHVDVTAPPAIVWSQVSDPGLVLGFFAGVTRWEHADGPRVGLGARYRMLMRVGSAEVGGLIEVVEFDPERDFAWHSVTGVDHRGRWRVRPDKGDGARVELRIEFGASGAWGWVADRFAAPIVRGNAKRTLRQLARAVDHERVREEARARRASA